jgi:uncharacterized protein involved in cysteine biosynthesis
MLESAAKALAQMLSPGFRGVLLKSMGLAAAVLIVLVIALAQFVIWLAGTGGVWIESTLGPSFHTPVTIALWLVSILASLGLVVGALFLMPAATALVAGLFGDEIAHQVERTHYPSDPVGAAVPLGRAAFEAVKFFFLTVLVYLCAVPFLLVGGLGIVIFFLANAYLLSRQYFELAAMRMHPVAEAKALRKANRGVIMRAGLLISLFVSIPIVNLATPLFGTALMVHLHKRLTRARLI